MNIYRYEIGRAPAVLDALKAQGIVPSNNWYENGDTAMNVIQSELSRLLQKKKKPGTMVSIQNTPTGKIVRSEDYKWELVTHEFTLTTSEIKQAYRFERRDAVNEYLQRKAVKNYQLLDQKELRDSAIAFDRNFLSTVAVEDLTQRIIAGISFPDSYFCIMQIRPDSTLKRFERFELQDPFLHFMDYEVVWKEASSDVSDDPGWLDEVFTRFNLDRPENFKGHSLSVSDVIVIKENTEAPLRAFYVDSFGFQELPEEFWDTY